MDYKIYAQNLKSICMNLLSHHLPDEYLVFESGLTQLFFILSDKNINYTLDWNGEVITKCSSPHVHSIKLTGYDGYCSSPREFYVGYQNNRFIWGYYSSNIALGLSSGQIFRLSDAIPLMNPPPGPQLNPAIEVIKRQRWTESEPSVIVQSLPAYNNANHKFIIDLLKCLPQYKNELASIKEFAAHHMKENPNLVFDETNGASVVPAFRRWLSSR